MRRRALQALILISLVGLARPAGTVSAVDTDLTAAACSALAQQSLPNTRITSAEAVTNGSFTPQDQPIRITGLPGFCRVAGTIAPTPDSEIRFELWMPLEQWNGKFAGVGNGGWAGVISYPALVTQLRRGYASASTNTGHEAGPGADAAKFAFEKPERLVDFAYRSHHETAVKAKALIEALYGKAAAHAYFVGCSSGGYEGLMEAQRFPADYDGIVAGMPANNFTRLMAGDFDATLASLQDPASVLSPVALSVLNRAVLASCDATDGVSDGVLEDPRQCKFDPASLVCTAGQDASTCLTKAQAETARRIYAGPKNPNTGAQIYPGLAPGSELAWPNRDASNPFPIPVSYYRWLVFGDPNWDWKAFRFTNASDFQAHQKADAKYAPILNATSPNLTAFRQRGGKILQYHGWNDQLISPHNSIDYYESVLSHFGGGKARAEILRDVQTFYRLFMAPGMAHCGGGPGPNNFDMQAALEAWVEQGTAPAQVLATRNVNGAVERTRPLCPYPQVASYSGTGDTSLAASYICR